MLLVLVALTLSVDKSRFNTCAQTPFCQRNRDTVRDKYFINKSSLSPTQEGNLEFVISTQGMDSLLTATLSYIQGGKVRFTVREKFPKRPRYESPNILRPLQPQLLTFTAFDGGAEITQGLTKVGLLTFSPFSLDLFHADKKIATVNGRQLLKFETQTTPQQSEGIFNRLKSSDLPDQNEDQDVDTSDVDEKVEGEDESLTSVGVDVTFHGYSHAYGLPERGSPLVLKSSRGGDPYRMYNADVFEYDIEDYSMSLYGTVPLVLLHGDHDTVGMFWHNTAETWVDLDYQSSRSVGTHWFSEMGVLDLFVLVGPSPQDLFRQYTQLTGTHEVPPLFALGFHQSRWNYNDQEDVEEVSLNFEKFGIPLDFVWLDIEHTVDRKYFIWDKTKFSDPLGMLNTLSARGRKLVVIVDPHLKATEGYYVYSEAKKEGFLVNGSNGGEFTGWCWPGHSGWPDFTNPAVREWWSSLFSFDRFVESNTNLHLWVDMNEPSVFNHPEMTLPRDSLHHNGRQHREVHNEYGMLMAMASWEGMKARSGHTLRPFMLSRSFFAGAQRFGAYWNGDNAASWEHLRHTIPMLLSITISGIDFVGADVGGFFGRPDGELMVRWHQLGAWVPFFRAHAHIDSPRREPWLFSEVYTDGIKQAIRSRYSFLPYWYTLFARADGLPVMAPLWVHFPKDHNTFPLQESFMVGSAVLVVPVLHPGVSEVMSYLPGDELWYYAEDLTQSPLRGPSSVKIPVRLYSTPIFFRGGSIIPRRHYVRRSASLSVNDPVSLTVVLDSKREARGELYIDDYVTYNYSLNDMFCFSTLLFSNNVLHSRIHGNYKSSTQIDRINFYGLETTPTAVEIVHGSGTVEAGHLVAMGEGSVMLRMPGVGVCEGWTIRLK